MKYMDLAIIVDRSSNDQERINKINAMLDRIYNLIKYTPEFAGIYLSVLQFPVFRGEESFVIKGEIPGQTKCEDRKFNLTAKGNTNPAPTLEDAVNYLSEHYVQLKARKLSVAHPLAILLSDCKLDAGVDSDEEPVNPEEQRIVERAYHVMCERIKTLERNGKFQMKVFGIGNADMEKLRMLTVNNEDVYDYTNKEATVESLEEALIRFYSQVFEQTSKRISEGEAARASFSGLDQYFTNDMDERIAEHFALI